SSDILEVSRIEGGRLNLSLEDVDLCEKIRNVIDDTKGRNLPKHVNIVFQPTQDKIIVQADRAKIYEVISNLVANAVKFTKQGTIMITAKTRQVNSNGRDSPSEVMIEVKDTGVGIAPEIMPRLFSKFVSNDQTGGTGLGLFISKNIVEAHRGKMW